LPDEAEYTRALSLSRLAYDLEQLLSPSLAALLVLMLSFDALFALNGAAFLISAALIRSVLLPRAAAAERPESVLGKITYGIRLYLATPRLRGLLALSVAVAAAGAMVIVNTASTSATTSVPGRRRSRSRSPPLAPDRCWRHSCCRACWLVFRNGRSCSRAAP
jgi:hypothetical protein